MTPITVYHLKACDTCRKALKALAAKGYDITAIDVRADGVPKAELTKIAEAAGWEALLNTRSTTWRGLDETSKADMSEAKALDSRLDKSSARDLALDLFTSAGFE